MSLKVKRNYFFPVVLCTLALVTACEQQQQTVAVFDTPEAAIQALTELIDQNDKNSIEQVFGEGSADIFSSGDAEADREDYTRINEMIGEWVGFEDFDENTKIALLGDDAWSWPIPLVREGNGWRFDMVEGREELLNRRIGNNELWTLTSLHEVVEAQREYRNESRDGNPPAYAKRFRSTEGNHDGLYWPAEGELEQSPLGELLAGSETWDDEPRPFHGYFYRILTHRSANAPGGEMNYLDENGFLTHGFAVIAWPAKYGNSGIMTFVINHRGLIFEKDFGLESAQMVAAIDSYDPDSSWAPTEDTLTGDEE